MPTNGEIIRASYTAFARGDLDGALSAFAPDIEWTHPGGLGDLGTAKTRKGHEEVREFLNRARAAFSSLRSEPREFVEADDRVVVFGVHHLEGALSGVAGSVPFVHSWRFADGKATHFDGRHDTSEVRRIVEPAPAAPDPRVDIIQLGLGFWASKVLLSAVELGVFTELAAEPRDVEALRSALGLHERGARDFLDALVSLGLLEREAGVYRTTAATGQLLDKAKPDDYIGGALERANKRFYLCWENLTEALRTGLRPIEATDHNPFDTLYGDPERMRAFLRAMSGVSAAGNAALVDAFPWSQHGTVVDIGCAEGSLVGQLLRRHRRLAGIGFDLPQVGPVFEETAARLDLADRMTFVPGNFFTDPLPTADVIVFAHVLHDWDLETKRMLLAKAYDALPEGGVVVVCDALIDDDRRRNTFGLLMSLHMFLMTPGGFDYTGADCRGWLVDAGFRETRVQHLAGPDSMVVAVK